MTDSILLSLLGDHPLFRILDFLVDNKGLDFSKQAIAAGAGISKASLFNYWPVLERHGLVKKTRQFGKTALFTLDAASEVTQRLLALEATLIRRAMVAAKERPVVAA